MYGAIESITCQLAGYRWWKATSKTFQHWQNSHACDGHGGEMHVSMWYKHVHLCLHASWRMDWTPGPLLLWVSCNVVKIGPFYLLLSVLNIWSLYADVYYCPLKLLLHLYIHLYIYIYSAKCPCSLSHLTFTCKIAHHKRTNFFHWLQLQHRTLQSPSWATTWKNHLRKTCTRFGFRALVSFETAFNIVYLSVLKHTPASDWSTWDLGLLLQVCILRCTEIC